jgi:LSD1 subclass zinc finger protein
MYPPPPSSIYAPPMLVNCSGCRTPLQLPSGARSIRCALCQAVTHIADPRTAPPPQPSSAPSPPPQIHAPPGQLPHPHGRKRAVICGISYRFSRHELKGCINDAKCMRHLLINKFKFSPDSILMLTGTEYFYLFKCLCLLLYYYSLDFEYNFPWPLQSDKHTFQVTISNHFDKNVLHSIAD